MLTLYNWDCIQNKIWTYKMGTFARAVTLLYSASSFKTTTFYCIARQSFTNTKAWLFMSIHDQYDVTHVLLNCEFYWEERPYLILPLLSRFNPLQLYLEFRPEVLHKFLLEDSQCSVSHSVAKFYFISIRKHKLLWAENTLYFFLFLLFLILYLILALPLLLILWLYYFGTVLYYTAGFCCNKLKRRNWENHKYLIIHKYIIPYCTYIS